MTKNLKKMLAFAVSGMLAVCCSSVPVQAADTAVTVTIDQIDVTLTQLKDSDYEVPVFVRMNQNVNLNAVEFGIAVDSRCRFDLVTRSQYSEIYGEKISMDMTGVLIPGIDNGAWMTWAKQAGYYEEGTSNLVMLLVKIPDSAQKDDVYEIRYLAQSPADETKKHLWFDYETLTDYSKENAVVWGDGKIHIIDESEQAFTAGDVTLDGEVDILDVITVNKAVLGKEILTDLQNKAADVDGDGKPTANDALMILKKIVGLTD